MSDPSRRMRKARCACGGVELETTGEPILATACYCDDCQKAAASIEGVHAENSVLDAAGGTQLLLFRKDRMKCSKGEQHLLDHKLNAQSPTKRVVASCCNSYMYLDFQKGHWFSICRTRFEGNTPPVQMRIQTKFKREGANIPTDVPGYSSFPVTFVAKLLLARVAMLFSDKSE